MVRTSKSPSSLKYSRRGFRERIKERLPFRRKLQEALETVSVGSSSWDDLSEVEIQREESALHELDEEALDKKLLEHLHQRVGFSYNPEESKPILNAYSREEKLSILLEFLHGNVHAHYESVEYYIAALSKPKRLTDRVLENLRVQLKYGSFDYIKKFQQQKGIERLVQAIRWCEYQSVSLWHFDRIIELHDKSVHTEDSESFPGVPMTTVPSNLRAEENFKKTVSILCNLVQAVIAILRHPYKEPLQDFLNIPDTTELSIRILEWCPLSLQSDIFLLIAAGLVLLQKQKSFIFVSLQRVPLYHQEFFHTHIAPELCKGQNVSYKISYLTLVNTIVSLLDNPRDRTTVCRKYISPDIMQALQNFALVYPDDALCLQIDLIEHVFELEEQNNEKSLSEESVEEPVEESVEESSESERVISVTPSEIEELVKQDLGKDKQLDQTQSVQDKEEPQSLEKVQAQDQKQDQEQDQTQAQDQAQDQKQDQEQDQAQDQKQYQERDQTQAQAQDQEQEQQQEQQEKSNDPQEQDQIVKPPESEEGSVVLSTESEVPTETNAPSPPSVVPPPPSGVPPPPSGVPPPPSGVPPPPSGGPPPPPFPAAKKDTPYIPFTVQQLPRNLTENSIYSNFSPQEQRKKIDRDFVLNQFLKKDIVKKPAIVKAVNETPDDDDDLLSERGPTGSFAIEVVLRGFSTQNPVSTQEILSALETGEPTPLREEDIDKLLSLFPTKNNSPKFPKEEGKFLKLSPDATEKLSRPERFLYDLYSVGRPCDRLSVLKYQLSLIDQITTIAEQIKIVFTCLKSFQANKYLEQFLETVVTVSNLLTQPDVPVQSMDMTSLSKLKSIKTSDRKKTLLHVIIETIQHTNPEILEFPEQLVFLKEAREGLEIVLEYSQLCSSQLQKGSKLVEELDLQGSKPIFERLRTDFENTQTGLEDIYKSMEFYGYTKARSDPIYFLSFWIDFIDTFKICMKWLEDNKYINHAHKRREAQRMRDKLIEDFRKSADHPLRELKYESDELGNSLHESVQNLRESSALHLNLRQKATTNDD